MEQNNIVMIIDDDETFLLPMRISLKKKDIQCITYTNPEEAIEYLKSNKVDVLLVDYHMEPNINGGEVVKRIREFDSDTIIYLQTAFSEEMPAEEMMDKYDIQGYIDKGKGDKESMQLIKSALKHAKVLDLVKQKEEEIAKLSYKNDIMGDLILHLINETKGQLFQIVGMNEAIKNNTEEYLEENNAINGCVEKIYKVYDALNFEKEENIRVNQLKDILEQLLKAKILINNAKLEFEIVNEKIVIEQNVDEIVYLILKTVDLIIKNNGKDIRIKIYDDENSINICISQNIDVNNINLKEILMINESENIKVLKNNEEILIVINK